MENIKDYILENDFKLILNEKNLFIANYEKIISIEDNFISILIKGKKINIHGSKINLQKLLKNELLIKGKIEKIEVFYE